MKTFLNICLISFFLLPTCIAQTTNNDHPPQIQTDNGIIQGIDDSGILEFKGIPYAQPPTGNRRWKPPKPVKNWSGIRKTDQFAPRCMQKDIFGDLMYRSKKASEDCLYLNVWTPVKSGNLKNKHLPVLVYFYGGGFVAGDGSELRYDGKNMARHGIVTITVNYRLGVFGFLALPSLTKESPNNASGDYGLLDQVQALRWVKKNVASFGGDPDKVTIGGQSAGSLSISALITTPLSQNLFRGAIGESGSVLGTLSAVPLNKGEKTGEKFEQMVGAQSLSELRAISADSLLDASLQQNVPRFPITVDGYYFPESPFKIYAEGQQANVPLLVGWNSEEVPYQFLMGNKKPTPKNFSQVVHKLYGKHADSLLALYPHATTKQAKKSATDLASTRFIKFSTWKWSYMQNKTADKPVYRYYYSHIRPPAGIDSLKSQFKPTGAVHAAEIPYVLGNLPRYINIYKWTYDDYNVSHIFENYVVNFIKTGNPNGLGLPSWNSMNESQEPQSLYINVQTQMKPLQHPKRYLFLDKISDQTN